MFKNSAGNLCTHLIYVSYIYACVRACVGACARARVCIVPRRYRVYGSRQDASETFW